MTKGQLLFIKAVQTGDVNLSKREFVIRASALIRHSDFVIRHLMKRRT